MCWAKLFLARQGNAGKGARSHPPIREDTFLYARGDDKSRLKHRKIQFFSFVRHISQLEHY